jgi:hypothetical protein
MLLKAKDIKQNDFSEDEFYFIQTTIKETESMFDAKVLDN